MNPYQPPLSKDEAPLPGPLMQVRYGRFYTWFMAGIAVMVSLPNAILA